MEKALPTEETFKTVFEALLSITEKETKDKYSGIIEALKVINMDMFDLKINYPLGNCIKAFHKTYEGAFIYEYFRYVENCFTQFIVTQEGTCCSVDKSRYIIRGLYNKFEKGTDFSLTRTEDKEYWKTKCLTVPECEEFFKAIESAFYGNHEKLIVFYLRKGIKNDS